MKKYFYYLGFVITSISLAFFLFKVYGNIPQISSLALGPGKFSLFVALLLAYLMGIYSGGYAWYRLLRAQGEACSLSQVQGIFFISQPAKYLPGNVGHYLSRLALARSHGFDGIKVLHSMGLETAILLLAGITCSLFSVFFLGWDFLASGVREHLPEFAVSPIFRVLIVMFSIGGITLMLGWREKELRRRGVAASGVCLLLYLGNFLLMGGMVYLLALWIFDAPGGLLWLTVGVSALAWTAGFVVPGAPAGLGIREVILVAGLGPLYGETNAVGISLALRFLTLFGDGLGFVVGLMLQRKIRAMAKYFQGP